MKLHLARDPAQQLFTGYGDGYVTVNGARYERNVIVGARSVSDWRATGFAGLAAADFEFIAECGADIAVIGTGPSQRFPGRELARALVSAGASIEFMDNGAACRTYNILAADGRNVVAAILVRA